MAKSSLYNFHVPLPKDLYNELREEADKSALPATVLARHVIELWLRKRKKEKRAEAIAAYAAANAGGPDDLDPALEAAGIEQLLKDA